MSVSSPPGSEPSRHPLASASSGSPIPAPASSRLIADGDSVARNAFRVGLRDDTPLPLATAMITQELDPGDILEVQDMAQAIARAEQLVLRGSLSAAPAPAGPDIFDSLTQRPTDDTAGPASPAPPHVAAGGHTASGAQFGAYPAQVATTPQAPIPRYLTMPTPAPGAAEDDAYFHPVGRMRSLADVTLDGYRPEPTLLLRAATRRKRFAWILAAVLMPLLVLAAIAVLASAPPASPILAAAATPTPVTPVQTPASTSTTPAAAAPVVVAPRATTPAAPQSTSRGVTKYAPAPALTSGTPTFDVNSLPTARPGRSKR